MADSGRIYCFYTKEIDRYDNYRQPSGSMGCMYSDDNGCTWAKDADIPMPRNRYDNPDGRLFTTMRTWEGHVWYSVSEDDGAHWRPAEMLRYHDGGNGVKHPLSCCPIYPMNNGKYLLLFHNNSGRRLGHDQLEIEWKTNHLNFVRNPTYVAAGTFQSDACQPIWFSKPSKLFNTDDTPIGPKGTAEIATCTSMTEWHDKRVLWYPDRKYYLLGKYIPDALVMSLESVGAGPGAS